MTTSDSSPPSSGRSRLHRPPRRQRGCRARDPRRGRVFRRPGVFRRHHARHERRRARRHRARALPGLPVVLTSGYSNVLAENAHRGFELIQKPYSVELLSRILRKAISEARPQGRKQLISSVTPRPRRRPSPMPAARGFLRRTRRAEQVALHLVQPRCTVSRCCRVSTPSAVVIMLRSAAMLHHRADDRGRRGIARHFLDEGAVDLDLVERKRCRYCSEE